MLKTILAVALALAPAAPLVPAAFAAPDLHLAQAAPKAKPLTPQRQKMRDCAAKWGEEKSKSGIRGRIAYRKFMSQCLRKTAA
jgi:hypothetical protein